MHALRTLTLTQARLYLREPANVFFGLAFPTVLLVAVAYLLPGMRETIDDAGPALDGIRPMDVYLPVVLTLAIATIALTTFPPTFGVYRERGVLRRLATTPMPASRLLVAEIVVNVAALVAGVVIALGAAAALLGVVAPAQPVVLVVVFLLGSLQMMALGCLIAALVPTGGAASAVSMSLYFPMLVFAGVWTPGPAMPEALARVATYVPLGAVSQGLIEGWFGDGVPVTQLLVMVGWTVVLIPLAARLFRWR